MHELLDRPVVGRSRFLNPSVALVAVTFAGLADAATTWVCYRVGGAVEANPLARSAFDTLGLGTTLALRVVIPLAAYGLLLWYASIRRMSIRLLSGTCITVASIWTLVAAHNLYLVLVYVR